MGLLTQLINVMNAHGSFNVGVAVTAIATTLTPPSYAGWPSTGQFTLVFQDNFEIVLVTDASVHPWPILRGQEASNGGGAAASHAIGIVVIGYLTAGALQSLVDQRGGPGNLKYLWESFR